MTDFDINKPTVNGYFPSLKASRAQWFSQAELGRPAARARRRLLRVDFADNPF